MQEFLKRVIASNYGLAMIVRGATIFLMVSAVIPVCLMCGG